MCQHGISRATWPKGEARGAWTLQARLKALEEEDTKPETLLAEAMLREARRSLTFGPDSKDRDSILRQRERLLALSIAGDGPTASWHACRQ